MNFSIRLIIFKSICFKEKEDCISTYVSYICLYGNNINDVNTNINLEINTKLNNS